MTVDIAAIEESDVTAWLERHPDFLARHPAMLDVLHLPGAKRTKGVADFQSHMIKRLRTDRDEVLESAREVIETSRANMNNQTRMHKCVLMLLDARTFEEFIRTITMDFAAVLDVDVITLLIENEQAGQVQQLLPGIRSAGRGMIDAWLSDQDFALEANATGNPDIFGAGAGLVKSQAFLRVDIAPQAPPAMIAFGSRDPQLFQPGQGTELVGFMGQVIARLMRIWLDLGHDHQDEDCGCGHDHG